MRHIVRAALLWLVAAAAYYGTAWLGIRMAVFPETVSPIWPATGVAIAALTMLGLRAWPAIAVAVYLAELPAFGPVNSLLLTAGNTAEAVIAAFVLRSAGGLHAFKRASAVIYFVAGVVVGAAVSASAAVYPLLSLGGTISAAELFVTWLLGDVTGGILVAPALILLLDREGTVQRSMREWLFYSTVALATIIVAFYPWTGTAQSPLFGFLAIIPLVWAASRLGPTATAWTAMAMALGAQLGLATAPEPEPSHQNALLLQLQAFAGMLSMLGLYLAAMVHERNHTIQTLDRTTRMRNQMLNKAAHEMRTPLTPAQIHMHALQEHTQRDPELAKSAGIIRRSLDRLTLLVDRMVQASNVNSDTERMVVAPTKLQDFARMVETTASSLHLKHCAIRAGRGTITMDRRAMSKAMEELLSNAAQYGERNVEVHMISNLDHSGRIIVMDDGPGIPRELREDIFNPFLQVNDDIRNKQAGLGLYLVRGVVQGHGGTIMVEDSPLGGAMFIIELPGRVRRRR